MITITDKNCGDPLEVGQSYILNIDCDDFRISGFLATVISIEDNRVYETAIIFNSFAYDGDIRFIRARKL